MHDKPNSPVDPDALAGRGLEALIADLAATDPAATPDIADAIAARLEGDLAATSADDGAAGSVAAGH